MIEQTKEGIWVVSRDTHIGEWVREHGSLECDPALFERLGEEINEGWMVWDIGANIGDHTAFYLRAVGAQGVVVAFEPHRDAFEALRLNCPEAQAYRIAAGNEFGVGALSKSENVGASHLNGTTGTQLVPVVPLGELFLPPPDFVKIDVEGYEWEALDGMRLILEMRPVLFIEINRGALSRNGHRPRDVYALLEEFGYTWEIIQPDCKPTSPQFDILCH